MESIKLFVVLFAHYLADYVFQSDYLQSTKGKIVYNLFVHCVLYTGVTTTFLYILNPNTNMLYNIPVIQISHMAIDMWKCTKPPIMKYLYIDQLLHILILFYLVGHNS